MEENKPIAAKDLLSAVASKHLKYGVNVDDGVVGLQGISDDEPTRRGLEEVSNGKGQWPAIVEGKTLVLVIAQIRIAIPLHRFNHK